jgi:hypothetical protein
MFSFVRMDLRKRKRARVHEVQYGQILRQRGKEVVMRERQRHCGEVISGACTCRLVHKQSYSKLARGLSLW